MSSSAEWTMQKSNSARCGFMPLGISGEELGKQSLKVLKAMCKERGLSANHDRKKLVARLSKYVQQYKPARSNPRFADWICPNHRCKAECFGSRSKCYKCNTMNPARTQPGDWSCPSCSAHCFASRSKCYRCGTANPKTVTVTLLAEHICTGEGAKKFIANAKAKYAVQQSVEQKQKASLRAFRKQREQAERRHQNRRQFPCASSDSGSMTDTASVSSYVPDVAPSLVPSETGRKVERYFRGGKSYYLLREGCVRERKELPRQLKPWEKSKVVANLETGTRVYVERVVGNRAKISSPVKGWISTVTANGDLLSQSYYPKNGFY